MSIAVFVRYRASHAAQTGVYLDHGCRPNAIHCSAGAVSSFESCRWRRRYCVTSDVTEHAGDLQWLLMHAWTSSQCTNCQQVFIARRLYIARKMFLHLYVICQHFVLTAEQWTPSSSLFHHLAALPLFYFSYARQDCKV